MAVFENKNQMMTVLGELFEKLMADPVMGPKFAQTNIVIKFNIKDPDASLWLTPGDGSRGDVLWGNNVDAKPTVEMTLSADTCHRFWLKEISMPVALAKGQIKAKGPMPKVLKLLPMLKPAYEAYPDLARSHGLPVQDK